jgi:lauroyl/myristoyl acyltransferase
MGAHPAANDTSASVAALPPPTSTSEAGLAERLAEVERPYSHLHQAHGQGLVGRLYARPELHRAIGLTRGVRLARLRGRVEWWVAPRRRVAARARAARLLGSGARGDAVRRLARAHMVELAIQTELSWHPDAARRMEVRGIGQLQRALAQGRGAILASVHLGPFRNLMQAIAARGHRIYVAGGFRLGELPAGHPGHWHRDQARWLEQSGCRLVPVRGGGYEVMRALLERGEVCWLNWDARGWAPVTLFGRTIGVRRGVAGLAADTGAPVIPAFVWREGDGQVGQLCAPLDPAAIDEEMARVVEAVVGPRLPQVHAVFARYFDRPGLG